MESMELTTNATIAPKTLNATERFDKYRPTNVPMLIPSGSVQFMSAPLSPSLRISVTENRGLRSKKKQNNLPSRHQAKAADAFLGK